MKLSEKQINNLAELFSGSTLEHVINSIQKQRGPQTYFDECGNLIMTADEILARLERTAKRNAWMARREKAAKKSDNSIKGFTTMTYDELKSMEKKVKSALGKKKAETIKMLKSKISEMNKKVLALEKK